MSEPGSGHRKDVDPDNMRPDFGNDDNHVDWLPSVDGHDDPTRIDAEPLSIADVEPVDAIAAMHADLAQKRRDQGRAQESQPATGSEAGPSADHVGVLTTEAVNGG